MSKTQGGNFSQIPNILIREGNLFTPTEFRILCVVISNIDEWVYSADRLAASVGCSKPTVLKDLKRLEETGLITLIKGATKRQGTKIQYNGNQTLETFIGKNGNQSIGKNGNQSLVRMETTKNIIEEDDMKNTPTSDPVSSGVVPIEELKDNREREAPRPGESAEEAFRRMKQERDNLILNRLANLNDNITSLDERIKVKDQTPLPGRAPEDVDTQFVK